MFRLVLSLIVFSNVVSGNAAHIKVEVHRSTRSVGLNDVDDNGDTQLHRAASDGLLDTVVAILFQDPDLTIKNYNGHTALDKAVFSKHLNVVKVLLLQGASPNSIDFGGSTALHNAAALGTDDIVIALIHKGANMTIKNNRGATPLHYAVSFRSAISMINILLAKGSPVNSVDNNGNIALHFAARDGKLDIALALLSYGADKSHRNNAGQTPRDLALARGHVDVANVL